MGVQWVDLKAQREYSDDDKHEAKGQRVYLVKCADRSTDSAETAAAACPAPRSSWSVALPGLVVTERSAKEVELTGDGGTLYEVTCTYATQSHDPTQDQDPLDRPPIVRLSFDSYEDEIWQAKTTPPDAVDSNDAPVAINWKFKKAIVNSAGRPFDPSIKEEWKDPVLTVTRNEAALPLTFAVQKVNRTNSDAFVLTYRGNTYNVDVGQAWLADISSENKFENGTEYEEVTYVIKLRQDGWKRKVLDQGLEELNNGDIPARPIKDANGDPIQVPAPLDGNGQVAQNGGALVGIKCVWLKFQTKDTTTFGDLNLDKSWNASH